MKSLALVCSLFTVMSFSGTSASAATATAITATGYNADIIVGSNSDTTNASVGGTGFEYYANADTNDDVSPTAGFPTSGVIPGSAANFQLQPFTADNVLQFGGSSSGTLTLTTPASYSDISLLMNGFNQSGPQSITFTYATGLPVTDTLPSQVPNWIGGNPTASGGTTVYTNDVIVGIFGQPSSLYEYDFNTDASRTLDSVTINANGAETMVYAISGAVPEPSTYAMMLGGLALLGFCVRRRFARA